MRTTGSHHGWWFPIFHQWTVPGGSRGEETIVVWRKLKPHSTCSEAMARDKVWEKRKKTPGFFPPPPPFLPSQHQASFFHWLNLTATELAMELWHAFFRNQHPEIWAQQGKAKEDKEENDWPRSGWHQIYLGIESQYLGTEASRVQITVGLVSTMFSKDSKCILSNLCQSPYCHMWVGSLR